MPRSLPWRLAAATTGLLALAAVAVAGPASAQPANEARQRTFAEAASEFGVPVDVLLAVSYLESRWDTHSGTPSTAAGYGPMHLTDVRTTGLRTSEFDNPDEDPRGDDSRPTLRLRVPEDPTPPPGSQTIDKAAELLHTDAAKLRTDAEANIRGGAALLAEYQRELGVKSDNAKDWYGAVARYSGSEDVIGARTFADEVFATINSGIARTTDDGQAVKLAAASGVTPDRAQADRLGLRAGEPPATECPRSLSCESVPAPFQKIGDSYGNYDQADRPRDQKIDYIVIHDTEGTWDSVMKQARTPGQTSWHYTVRSSDGQIAQHVPTKDVGWHAGNWYVNEKSLGVEHEGFAAQGAWFTEAMYRQSAKLVRYLARRFGVPLDRAHILGHDNVPGPNADKIKSMHWDPGPYWDWAHYFDLLGAPLEHDGEPDSGLVMIAPEFSANRPVFTGCDKIGSGNPCPERGSGSVVLHTEPSESAPLLSDAGMHGPDPSTMDVSDIGSRAATGQKYAVADTKDDWTAIWYLGQKGWFRNPDDAPTAYPADGFVATPKEGKTNVPVYGSAYPEAGAYPKDIPVQELKPLPYQLGAGQKYSVGGLTGSEYYSASFDVATNKVVEGKARYVEIQLGHRVAYVSRDDVDLEPAS